MTIYTDIIDFKSLKNELNLWYQFKKLRNLNSFEKIISEFKNDNVKTSFPQVLNLILVYLSIAIASVGPERAFSCLKRLKTYLRSTMGQTRVSSLGILNIENENIDLLNIDEVLEEFSTRSNRYLKFK